MQTIIVRKADLLEKLQENRANHRKVFEAALTGYRKEALERLERRVKRLKEGKLPSLYIDIITPEDHTKDYDRIIMMVQMHTGSSFELSESEFGSYVMDDWSWKRQWKISNSTYAAATVKQVYGDSEIEE